MNFNNLKLLVFVPILLFQGVLAQGEVKVETPNLKSEGIPNLPRKLVLDLVESFKREAASFVTYKPNGELVGYNYEYSPFVISPEGKRTDFNISLRFPEDILINPKNGSSFLFSKDPKDDEKEQIFEFSFSEQKTVQLTTSPEINNASSFIWAKSGDFIYLINADEKTNQDTFYKLNPKTKDLTKLISLKGNSHYLSDSNEEYLIYYDFVSNTHSVYFLYDLKSGQTKQITKSNAFFRQARFNSLNTGLYYLSDKEGNFNNLFYFDLKTGKERKVNNQILNITAYKISPDEKSVLFKTNENGAEQIRIFHLVENKTTKELPKPNLQPGVIERFGWKNNEEVGFTLESHLFPPKIESWNLKNEELKTIQVGKASPNLVNNLGESSVIRWKSFDNKEISGIIQKPKQVAEKLPVIIYIHGGPKLQYQPYYNVFRTFPVSYLNAASVFTNIRGSSGFGREFANLDNGEKRIDSIKDLEALITWIEKQPELDSSKIVVKGDSFGCFLALALAIRNPLKIKGVIAESPVISVKNAFYYSSKSVQDSLKDEYGSDQIMSSLESLSALNEKNLEILKKIPIFLSVGQKDVRVPVADVENLKNKLMAKGIKVWFLKALNEGHYWGDYDNRIFLNLSEIMFLKELGF